jgi:hypothetical protein
VSAENLLLAICVFENQNIVLVNRDSALNVTPVLACSIMPRELGADSARDAIALKYGVGRTGRVDEAHEIQPKATDVYTQKFDF